jgi:ATP-dependent Clp protease protease subunit
LAERFWRWVGNEAGGEGSPRVLTIDGAITEYAFWDDDVSAREFLRELGSGSGDLTLWINSPGGDCVAASAIYSALMEYQGRVTVKVGGIAASAASVVAMAGDELLMDRTALLMIHNPLTLAIGDSAEMARAREMLEEVKESIVNAYAQKTGLARERIAAMMDDETWMSAGRAVSLGFADGILSRAWRSEGDVGDGDEADAGGGSEGGATGGGGGSARGDSTARDYAYSGRKAVAALASRLAVPPAARAESAASGQGGPVPLGYRGKGAEPLQRRLGLLKMQIGGQQP